MRINFMQFIVMIVSLICLPWGCDAVYDNLSACPQGVNFHFYRQTPCEQFPHYPMTIAQVRVFAFDEKGILADEFSDPGFSPRADSFLPAVFKKPGKYTFVAWGAADFSDYDFSDFRKGETSIQDMRVSLHSGDGVVLSAFSPLHVGVASVDLKRNREGTVYHQVDFNMQELTYRLALTVELKGGMYSPGEEFVVEIGDDNGVYDFSGEIFPAGRINYFREAAIDGNGVLRADFMLMKLKEGRNARLSVMHKMTGEVIYEANLVEDIIMYREEAGPPPYNLACDHDIPVTLKLHHEKQTWLLVQATVLGWNVISRPVDLDGF